VKFGILYNTDYYPEVHGSPAKYFNGILEQIEAAEALGFDAAWFGEHHYSGYAFGSPAALAMAAAARTSTIRLGTGPALVPLHHPLRLAEEYATVDVLLGGRLDFGVGRGFFQHSYKLFGLDDEESSARYYEGTELILKAWTSPMSFSYRGAFWNVENHTFFPRPYQQPHPPIYASATATRETFIWAGRHGFHLLTSCFVPRQEEVRQGIELYRETLRSHGHDPAEKDVAGVFQFYCGEDSEQARHYGGEHILRYYEFLSALRRRGPHKPPPPPPRQTNKTTQIKFSYADLDVRNLTMIGDPDSLIARIRWAREFFGTNYLMLEVGQGGMPPSQVVPSLERFAKHVMPTFRDA
jgi:alkanesulfonate monooxygenase SsuD/methylene tetrahydromethanopterin reductase-like flavin-dependent oxidoreductase (luciferase family)